MSRLLPTLLLFAALTAAAAANDRYAAVIIDAETGDVLYEHQASQRWYPASLTKMMTAYLAFEAVERGELRLDEALTVSKQAAIQPDTRLGLRQGETLTAEQAIQGVVIRSGNDAAVLVAERLAGSEAAFARQMTAKARELGMHDTVFRNANGLTDKEQVTTARDMAILARALVQDFPQHYHYFSMRGFNYKGRHVPTTNGLLGSYGGADGIKTGFTCGSGYNLAASAERDGRRIIGVVLGGTSTGERNGRMVNLLNNGFRQAREGQVLARLHELPPAGGAPPPWRLSASECSVGVAYHDPKAGGKLPGWGILFGVFHDKGQAQQVVERARSNLGGAVKAGRPAIVRRELTEVPAWKAMMVGFKQEDAGRACKHLQATGTICMVLSPEAMNDPKGRWR